LTLFSSTNIIASTGADVVVVIDPYTYADYPVGFLPVNLTSVTNTTSDITITTGETS
jgi:hypothetical protein